MDIYIRNLSREVTEEDLRRAFEPYGQVASVTVVRCRASGLPAGFGFVDMPEPSQAISAINALRGLELRGREIHFNHIARRFERRKAGERRRASRERSERRGDSEISPSRLTMH